MKMAEDGGNWWQDLSSRRFFRHQHYSSNNEHDDTATTLEDSCLCFFQNTIWWNVDCIRMLQEISWKSHEIRKRTGIFAACLPICSERIQKRFYVYKQHEDGIKIKRRDDLLISNSRSFTTNWINEGLIESKDTNP
jgi:hypothetical protein